MGAHMIDVRTAQAFRISPNDTNYFVLLFEPADGIEQVCVVEIFSVGGATPPNTHRAAHELFYVLEGEGVAQCGADEVALHKGRALLVPAGVEHVIRNTGATKLYTLTTMCPNEGLAELVRSGEPVTLDSEDIEVLAQVASGRPG